MLYLGPIELMLPIPLPLKPQSGFFLLGETANWEARGLNRHLIQLYTASNPAAVPGMSGITRCEWEVGRADNYGAKL